MKNKGLLLLAGAAAYFLFFRKSGPTYLNLSGQAINSIECDRGITFDVPGYTQVWMSQLKDGVLHFDQPYTVPIPPYMLKCPDDVGTYEVAVYTLNPDNTKGELIGQTTFTVLPNA